MQNWKHVSNFLKKIWRNNKLRSYQFLASMIYHKPSVSFLAWEQYHSNPTFVCGAKKKTCHMDKFILELRVMLFLELRLELRNSGYLSLQMKIQKLIEISELRFRTWNSVEMYFIGILKKSIPDPFEILSHFFKNRPSRFYTIENTIGIQTNLYCKCDCINHKI